MRKIYRLEIGSVILVFLYQYARSSADKQFLGINDVVYFAVFGIYSLITTFYEILFFRNLVLNDKNFSSAFDKLNLIVALIFYLGISILLFFKTDLNTAWLIFSRFISLVYIIKTIVVFFLYLKVAKNS